MRGTRAWPSFVAAVALCLFVEPGALHARSLTGKLHRFLDTEGFPTNREFIEAVTPIVERLALRGIEFPPTATSPGFAYRFNFETGAPERATESFGPVFAERADTVGRRRLDLAATYLFADLTDFDGEDFGKQIVTRGATDVFGVRLRQGFEGTDFSLRNHVVFLSATYGLTNAWDLNVLQPLVANSLELRGNALASVESAQVPKPLHFEESAVGVGDTLLRTKYRLVEGEIASLAALFALRLPTGNPQDLHGFGDTTVSPGLALSRSFGANEVHGSVAVELNADDAERSRARYALGASVRPFERLAFLVDVLGSSSFVDDDFTLQAPAGRVFPGQAFGTDLVKSQTRTSIVAFVPRSDVVDLAVGMKVNPVGRLVAFATAILPLTADGLRAEVIPAVGVEASF